MELRQQSLTRYITPLREGGSLPALAEADDGFEYVVKFRGAGHGKKALISELIGGEIARALGFRVPELVFLNLDENFGRTEGDEEVQDLLKASTGLNLGLHYLSGAFTVVPYVNEIDDDTASRIVWLDAFITNVDRTVRNTNMLRWNRELWLIDHGAALYFHHAWGDVAQAALTPFAYIRDHALLPRASMIAEADKALRQRITPRTLQKIVGLIPDEWLDWDDTTLLPAELREAYTMFLTTRLANSNIFVKEAIDARQRLI
ncbi:HipA family kinase [Muribaculum intestinale]|uniref:HipA family kinase n=1 Tax=Muribaculum intestinale TaxID=1796646 RepID=UPI0025A9BA69|nr:HipA family kinase [Muribaculum intestinale]